MVRTGVRLADRVTSSAPAVKSRWPIKMAGASPVGSRRPAVVVVRVRRLVAVAAAVAAPAAAAAAVAAPAAAAAAVAAPAAAAAVAPAAAAAAAVLARLGLVDRQRPAAEVEVVQRLDRLLGL